MSPIAISRRAALSRLKCGLGGLAAISLGGCIDALFEESWSGSPRLSARPSIPTGSFNAGRFEFDEPEASGVVYVPSGADIASGAPLMLFLHGAFRTVDVFVDQLAPIADATGVILLAPYSRMGTWDAIYGGFGPDVERLNSSLRWVFQRWRIDPARIVMSGFSDGGTYALAIGRGNGDLFARVVAYSPGFLIESETVGKPPILITHGTQDTVLPINASSRVIVPALRDRGYEVDYREFEGGHVVQQSVVNEVMTAM